MLNVKALTWALAISAAFAFALLMAYSLMIPVDYTAGPAFGMWFPEFRGITFVGFLLGLGGAALIGAMAGLVVGTLNNFFHRLWVPSH